MYAIIYGKIKNDDDCFFVKNNNGSITLFSQLDWAKQTALEIHKTLDCDTRIISLESIK